MFAGEHDFSQDCRAVMSAMLAELPRDAALWSEYNFVPAGEGNVEVRFRILIETAGISPVLALSEARRLRNDLGVCLRVLSDWYSFKPIQFDDDEETRWIGSTIDVRPRPRLLAMTNSRIGFGPHVHAEATGRGILLAQPARSETDRGRAGKVQPFLLLQSTGRGALSSCLKASRGLQDTLCVRIGLRRESLESEALADIQEFAARLSAARHGASSDDPAPLLTGIGGEAAAGVIDDLLVQPDCLSLHVHAVGNLAASKAWLRILAHELLPDFTPEFVLEENPEQLDSRPRVASETDDEADLSAVTDLSRLISPGAVPPPFFPAPPRLEALGFPRHFANPAVEFSAEGILLGTAQVGGVQMDVRISEADRSQHCYVLGATGTGKSTLIYNMICQDMLAGSGLAMVDPHGDLFEQCLAAVPEHRKKDLVVIDPSKPEFTPGLNPLDFGGKPTLFAANRVASDLLEIFEQLYDMQRSGGPGFEDMFRNSLLVAVACPKAGPEDSVGSCPTLLSISHVLRDKDWRNYGLSKLEGVYGEKSARRISEYFAAMMRLTGEQSLDNWAPYITNKLTRFVSNETLGKMVCSDRRTIDFRSAMDSKKILLVNLSKGELGGADSRLVGMLLTKYMFHAAMGRADIPRKDRSPFYYYLDEFQNFICQDIDDILAEGRKFGLQLILANQTLGQLMSAKNAETLDAVLGNVATKLFMRVGVREAAILAPGFQPEFDSKTLMQLPDRHVLCRLLVKNRPSLPFVFQTSPPRGFRGT